jgi:type II secretory pathway pseudopilin PulG
MIKTFLKRIAVFLVAGSLAALAQSDQPAQNAQPEQPVQSTQPAPSQSSQPAAQAQPAPPAPTYQPKFAGDPARSNSEAAALGYMRTVIRAQREYKKKNEKYASSLQALVHTGSFTRRMTKTDRGDYTVSFRSRKDGYELTLTPKQLDAEHRSFYADDDGVIHADEQKAADSSSPKVK